ncbi:hypothetical protein VN97_g13205, partial [Penicillium thymicola]
HSKPAVCEIVLICDLFNGL